MGRAILVAVAVVAFVLPSGCGLASSNQAETGRLPVVAAENFWGSIASQVGGARVSVASIITNPATDPHDYDPTAADARAIATAAYVIVNGAGYDSWASKLVAANPVSGRRVLDVGALAGVAQGGNPHLWYSPVIVTRVIDRIAIDFEQLDAAGSSYFSAQSAAFSDTGLRDYHDTITAIQQRYAGMPVGATESIFTYMATVLGLDLVTPATYMKAISDGSDPSAADKVTVNEQITGRRIKVLVFNSQNATPDVAQLVAKARVEGIPVVAITETLTPARATFQDWQTAQLRALLAALGG